MIFTGGWVFPVAPNVPGISDKIDPSRVRHFRIQVEARAELPDVVTLEHSEDGRRWTVSARLESNVADGRVVLQIGSHEAVPTEDRARVGSVRCTGLALPERIPEGRDLVRF